MSILGLKKGISSVAAARLQRWAILLSRYHYDNRTLHMAMRMSSPDCPYPKLGLSVCQKLMMCNLRQLEMLLVTSQEIRRATQSDPFLSKVQEYMLKGWPI